MGGVKDFFDDVIPNEVKPVLPFVAPALSLLAPGLGTALGSALGATGATAAGLGNGLIGAGLGGITGGGRGALTGGLTGGAGGYLSGGGLTELAPETSNALYNSTGGLVGSSNGTAGGIGSLLGLSGSGASPDSSLSSASTGFSPSSPLNYGSNALSGGGIRADIAGSLGATPSLPTAPLGGRASSFGGSGAGGGMFSGLGGAQGIGALLGGANTLYANEQAKKDLINSQNQAMAQLQPYLDSGNQANSMLTNKLADGSLGGTFTPPDLTQDPGYQFQLQQGQQALDRQQAAKGNFFSGAALKGAEDYGQGLASTSYGDAYNRWLQGQQNTYGMLSGQAGVGANAANAAGNIATNIGQAKAGAGISSANTISQSLASLLGGTGAKKPINIGGQIVYV